MLWLRSGPSEVRIVNANVLLELLQSVVRPRSQCVEPSSVQMTGWYVVVGQECVSWDVVGGKPVERIRQHCDGSADLYGRGGYVVKLANMMVVKTAN